MTLQEIKTDEELVEGRQYSVKIKRPSSTETEWTTGKCINGTLMLQGVFEPKIKRLAFYELPE